MLTLHDLLPDVDAIVSLEPEELAGYALELIKELPNRLHPSAFASVDTIGAFPPCERDRLLDAMAETWNWLVCQGILAPRPGDTPGWHFLTRRGLRLRDRNDLNAFVASALIPRSTLHPEIDKSCWLDFLRGDYDTAVFKAFKELEVATREAGGYEPEDYGVDLVRKAFNKDKGPLTDKTKPLSEREALCHLMAGALGSYKNPHSHRKVQLGAEDACEMILLASHLLKIVDTRACSGHMIDEPT
jgi:uncharacterized protein (TIGR02391 family)